jgi:hypothetical protein
MENKSIRFLPSDESPAESHALIPKLSTITMLDEPIPALGDATSVKRIKTARVARRWLLKTEFR